jgi:hypothetical protein
MCVPLFGCFFQMGSRRRPGKRLPGVVLAPALLASARRLLRVAGAERGDAALGAPAA